MKRILATGAIAALAVVGSAAPASAAPSERGAEARCFGQVHKAVNTGGAVDGVDNVGQLVKAVGGGQAKNAAAKGFC